MNSPLAIGNATFYLGDCLEVMRILPGLNFDIILTDPPYGINEAAGKNKSRGNLVIAKDYGTDLWDSKRPDWEYFKEIRRISRNQIIFGGNYFADYLKPSPCWIVWDKENGNNDFADCELVYTSFKTAVRKKTWRWSGFMQQPGEKRDYREHPTQKPVGLIKWVIENYTKENDIICDPFMGSGTTAIACHQTNRKFIGIEKEKKYFDIAITRYRAEIKQLRLCDIE